MLNDREQEGPDFAEIALSAVFGHGIEIPPSPPTHADPLSNTSIWRKSRRTGTSLKWVLRLLLGIVFAALIIEVATSPNGIVLNALQNLSGGTRIEFGLWSPEPGAGLQPQDIRPRRDVRTGVELLIVEGNIANITDKAIEVPPVLVSLSNPENKVVASEIIELGTAVLEPGASVPFKAEFENPPATARQMTVEFVDSTGMNTPH